MRVTSYLMKRFRAPESALSFFEGHTPMPVQPPVLHYRDNSTQTYAHSSDVLAQMKTLLTALPEEEQASTIGQLMQYIAPPDVNVPPDFIKHALACMKNHTAAGRSNILAGLAKALGTKRPDGSSRMPVSEMPVGLLEYISSFFSSDSFYQVCVSSRRDMYLIHFPTCLHRLFVVRRTTSFGASPCIASLGQSGRRSMVVLCGQWKL